MRVNSRGNYWYPKVYERLCSIILTTPEQVPNKIQTSLSLNKTLKLYFSTMMTFHSPDAGGKDCTKNLPFHIRDSFI